MGGSVRTNDLVDAVPDEVRHIGLDRRKVRDVHQHGMMLVLLPAEVTDRSGDNERPDCRHQRLRKIPDLLALRQLQRQVGLVVFDVACRALSFLIGFAQEDLLRAVVVSGSIQRDKKVFREEVTPSLLVLEIWVDEYPM